MGSFFRVYEMISLSYHTSEHSRTASSLMPHTYSQLQVLYDRSYTELLRFEEQVPMPSLFADHLTRVLTGHIFHQVMPKEIKQSLWREGTDL